MLSLVYMLSYVFCLCKSCLLNRDGDRAFFVPSLLLGIELDVLCVFFDG